MITFEGKVYRSSGSNETVLDCLERNGVSVPSSCRSGVCQSCLMQATSGTPPSNAQKGLKPSLIAQNYFMSCSCVASEEMEVGLPDKTNLTFESRVLEKFSLTAEIVCLRLQLPQNYDYYSGQYLTLFKEDGLGRNYSLASVPGKDDYLELHIRKVAGGVVSTWVHEQLNAGDGVTIGHAIGNCFYVADNMEQPLLLVGVGCGLAPLVGILQAALLQGHKGPIKLYHGSRTQEGLYLAENLRDLCHDFPNLSVVQSISQGQPDGVPQGRATDLALMENPKLSGWRVYVCGTTEMVKATKRSVFLAGASMQEIYCDEFVVTKHC